MNKKMIIFTVVFIFISIAIFISITLVNNYYGITTSFTEMLALVFSEVAILVSILIFFRTQKSNTMPIIVFEQISEKTWLVENVGVGPAINILVANNHIKGKWFPIIYPPLSAGASIKLDIFEKDTDHVAIYYDIKGNAYTTICVKNKHKFFEQNKFPEWKPFMTEMQQKKYDNEIRSMF
jgi:hypothetical protein